ncbi:MAG: hypothetical protein QM758_20720 [Armatimonas sp.]
MPFLLPFVVPVLAQELTAAPAGQGLVVRSGPQSELLRTLVQALPSLAWKVSERGPLLVVGADKVALPDLGERTQKQAIPALPPPNTPAKAIADLFEYRIEQVGTLYALVPTKIKRFLGAPDISPVDGAFLEQNELAKELGYSLSKEQWAALGSANGLGMNDLTPKQQAMFLELLPEPIRLRPTEPTPTNGPGYTELTLEQRAQIRLKMDRRLQLSYLGNGENMNVSFGGDPAQKKRTFFLEYLFRNIEKETLYSRTAPLVPNKPKPCDLDFAAAQLDPHVPFAELKTVEAVVDQVRQVTGARVIVADPRLGKLSVQFWGESARAGDILKALCRSVGGTFRKVGTGPEALYVFTEDIVGLGTRLTAFGEWRSEAESQRWKQDEKRRKVAEGLNLRGIAKTDDPYGLSPEQLAAVDKSRYVYQPAKDRGIEVASLPAGVQTQIQQTLDKTPTFRFNSGGGEQEVPLRRDRVMINASYRMLFLVPGWGETDAQGLWALANVAENADMARYYRENPPQISPVEPKPLRYPEPWKIRALSVRPKDPTESRALAKLAKANGFTTLLVTVPLDAARARPLLDAAQAEKLPVVAVADVLLAPASAIPPGAEPDISILGETSDKFTDRQRRRNESTYPGLVFPAPAESMVYLAPTMATQKVVIERVAALAKIPGLAGFVLRSIVPPGYTEASSRYTSDRALLGYSLENRLAFLAKESTDPIDLPSQFSDSRLFSPFFDANGPSYIRLATGQVGPDPNWKDRQRLWHELLAGRIGTFKKTLFTRLKENNPTLSLWVFPIEAFSYGSFLSRWEKPEASIGKPENPWETRNQLVMARAFSNTALVQINPILRDQKKKWDIDSWRASLEEQTKAVGPNGGTWNGFYVDLSLLSLADIEEMLPFYKEAVP